MHITSLERGGGKGFPHYKNEVIYEVKGLNRIGTLASHNVGVSSHLDLKIKIKKFIEEFFLKLILKNNNNVKKNHFIFAEST
jgi:hypothetical protein